LRQHGAAAQTAAVTSTMPPVPSAPPRRFAGRVALVTGAAGGIGSATAVRLAAEGAALHLVDVADCAATAAAVEAAGGRATTGTVDVTDPVSCAAAVAGAVDAHGRVDALANIAGIGQMGPVEEISPDEWRRIMAVNLDGVFFMSQAALGALEATRGTIVNLASVAGLVGQPYTTAYCASKGGVVLLTKAMAIELWGRGIRVNCICPGGVATRFASGFDFSTIDLDLARRTFMKTGEVMTAEEVAAAVAYVASGEARSMTGAAISIDHGQSAM
jgi:meso-butanediol dehydrogenase/(S,S)-butanediol dehydrogenase/diacetyl reductase